METNVKFIIGELNKADWSRKSTFEFAYDIQGNVLHLLDRGEHKGTSLINCISSKLKDDFVFSLGDVLRLDRDIMENGLRCFVYQDGIIDEYVFEKERQRETSFISAKKGDKELLYEPFIVVNREHISFM